MVAYRYAKTTPFITELVLILHGDTLPSSEVQEALVERIIQYFKDKEAIYWSVTHDRYFIQFSMLDFLDQTQVEILEACVPHFPRENAICGEPGALGYTKYLGSVQKTTVAIEDTLYKKGLLNKVFGKKERIKFSQLSFLKKLGLISGMVSLTAFWVVFTTIVAMMIFHYSEINDSSLIMNTVVIGCYALFFAFALSQAALGLIQHILFAEPVLQKFQASPEMAHQYF